MAINLPAFEDTLCQMVGVCSEIEGAESASPLPSEDIEMVSSYRAHSGKAMIRLIWNPSIGHFHVDAALHSWFVGKPPKADTTISKFRKALARFEGRVAAAYPHSYFVIPLGALPTTGGLIFVGNSGIKLSTEKAEIELTGATLTLRRSSINKIRWELDADKEEVLLRVDAKRRNFSIDDSYLTGALKNFDSAVATFILGKRTDDKY